MTDRDEVLNERERIKEIRALAADFHAPGVVEEAIDEGWSPDRTAREILRRENSARRSRLKARVADEAALDAPDARANAGPAGGGARGGSGGAGSVIRAAAKAGVIDPSKPKVGDNL